MRTHSKDGSKFIRLSRFIILLKYSSVSAVIQTGKAHGAHPEDIYGCLYFFLSEQLRMCARRICKIKMSFSLFASDARLLPKDIHEGLISGCGIPPSIRFDRIEVSNILDANYVGINDVLLNWSSLMAESNTSVIVGYFMNWFTIQEDGRAQNASETIARSILRRVMDKAMVSIPAQSSNILRTDLSRWIRSKAACHNPVRQIVSSYQLAYKGVYHLGLVGLQNAMYLLTDDMDALYENSKPFSMFLKKRGLNEILRKAKLRLQGNHTIVPHVGDRPFV